MIRGLRPFFEVHSDSVPPAGVKDRADIYQEMLLHQGRVQSEEILALRTAIHEHYQEEIKTLNQLVFSLRSRCSHLEMSRVDTPFWVYFKVGFRIFLIQFKGYFRGKEKRNNLSGK